VDPASKAGLAGKVAGRQAEIAWAALLEEEIAFVASVARRFYQPSAQENALIDNVRVPVLFVLVCFWPCQQAHMLVLMLAVPRRQWILV